MQVVVGYLCPHKRLDAMVPCIATPMPPIRYFTHPPTITDDVATMGRDQLTITPTGSAFLQPNQRAGILPAILSALMSARATTRAALKVVQQQQKQQKALAAAGSGGGDGLQQLAARAAVLDGRQKALKLTANAL